MTIENDNKGTEQTTEQVLDILGAGEAFKTMFENPDNLPATEQGADGNPPAETQNNDGDFLDIPVDEGQAPQVTPDSLNMLKSDIIGELRSLMESAKSEETPPGELPAEPENTIDSEEFMEKFSADPVLAVQELANMIADKKVAEQMQALTGKLEPVLKQSEAIEERNRAMEALSSIAQNPAFSDLGNFSKEMAEYIKQNNLPKDDPNSYKEAYLMAKNQSLSGNKPLEDYLSDESSIEKIIQTPAIRDKIITAYLKDVSENGKPAIIQEGTPAATPKTEINTFDDAAALLKKQLSASNN
ncbi:MAG: hypothetical protein PHE79_09710 [Eubacteriales bacterium]|nr:hypothetical protein [Eubacteriales bacterium]